MYEIFYGAGACGLELFALFFLSMLLVGALGGPVVASQYCGAVWLVVVGVLVCGWVGWRGEPTPQVASLVVMFWGIPCGGSWAWPRWWE